MLKSLQIRNIVLIDELNLDFAKGLSALTGETGAGKSILLDSLGLALGARAETGLVRKGSDASSVTVEFELPDKHPALALLAEQDIEAEDNLILRRTLSADGKSKAFINNMAVSAGFLKTLGETLVDIHGQFETYGLLNPATHRSVLDDYANVVSDIKATNAAYKNWKDKIAQLQQAKIESERAAANEQWLRDSIKDMRALRPEGNEEDELIAQRQKLQSRDSVVQALSYAEQAIASEKGADAQIANAWKSLQKVADKLSNSGGGNIDETLAMLDRASNELQAAHRAIEIFIADVETGEQSLEMVEDRLYELRAQARKHNCQVNDLLGLLEDMESRIKLMDHQDHILADLEKAVRQARADYMTAAKKLHEKRSAAGAKLDRLVNKELAPLKLEKAKFMTSVTANDNESDWGPNGFDEIAFLVSTNAQNEPSPLHKTASGGEMARFMLAL